jgi:hypothetical protein
VQSVGWIVIDSRVVRLCVQSVGWIVIDRLAYFGKGMAQELSSGLTFVIPILPQNS